MTVMAVSLIFILSFVGIRYIASYLANLSPVVLGG